MLEGKSSAAARPTLLCGNVSQPGPAYASVADYDLVLRSHCRLEKKR